MTVFREAAKAYAFIEYYLKKCSTATMPVTVDEIHAAGPDVLKNRQQVTDCLKSLHRRHKVSRMKVDGRTNGYWWTKNTAKPSSLPQQDTYSNNIQQKVTASGKKVPQITVSDDKIIITSDKFSITIEL